MPEFTVPVSLVTAPVVVVDTDLAVLAANGAAEELWGPGVVETRLDTLVREPREELEALVLGFLRSPSPQPGGILVEQDGEVQRVRVVGCRAERARPLAAIRFDLDGAGRFTELTHTIDRMNGEIARRRQVEAELQSLLTTTVADLETANAALRRFAGGAAHDLRGPLSTLLGYAELARDHDDLPAEVDELVERMGRVARRGLDLVTDLLADAMAVAEHEAPEPVGVGEVLREVEDLLEDRLVGHELTAGSLPTVRARPAAVRQVLLNLVANAVVHHGPGRAHVHLEAEDLGTAWVVRVIDDGPGIPAEDRDRVLEQGVRLGATTGAGYGLAHCRRIVEGLGGRLWFDDPQPGQGTVACVRLPAVIGAPDD